MIRSPFSPRNRASLVRAKGDAVELLLYDEVGFFGVSAKAFADTLAEIDADEIHLRINSPGGDVFDGVAMYNALRQHPAHVVTHIDGLAASISSVIALAGDEVRMAPNAFFMIHNPWGVTIGDADIHRKMADTLDKIARGSIINTYQAKTGVDVETIETWMDDETWFSAEQAAEAGFVDAVDDPAPVEARAMPFDLSIYQNAPGDLVESYLEAATARSAEACRELEHALREEGLSRSEAKKRVSRFKEDVRKMWQRDADTVTPTPLRDEVRADTPALAAAEAMLANLTVGALQAKRSTNGQQA